MNRLSRLLLASSFMVPIAANAQQTVRQSGNVTPGHVGMWITTGVLGDGGAPGTTVFTGATTTNDFVCVGAGSTLIDCGLSATGTNAWAGVQNFNGGATAPTRTPGDSTTNLATTAFVGAALAAGVNVVGGVTFSGTPSAGYVPIATSSSTAVWGNDGALSAAGFSGGSVGAQLDAACSSLSGNPGTLAIPANIGLGWSLAGFPANCAVMDYRQTAGYSPSILPGYSGGEFNGLTLYKEFSGAATVYGQQNVSAMEIVNMADSGGSNNDNSLKTNWAALSSVMYARTIGQTGALLAYNSHFSNGDTTVFDGVGYSWGRNSDKGSEGTQGVLVGVARGTSLMTGTITGISGNVVSYGTGNVFASTLGEGRPLLDTVTGKIYQTGTISSVTYTTPASTTTTAATGPGGTVLALTSAAGIVVGMAVNDISVPAAIDQDTVVVSISGLNVTLSKAVLLGNGVGVGNGNTIAFAGNVVVGSGTAWTGIGAMPGAGYHNDLFLVLAWMTTASGQCVAPPVVGTVPCEVVIPITGITSDTNLTLDYRYQGNPLGVPAIPSSLMISYPGQGYKIYQGSLVTAVAPNPGTTGSVTVANAADFSNGDTIKEALGYIGRFNAGRFLVTPALYGEISEGITMTNSGPFQGAEAWGITGNWQSGIQLSGGTIIDDMLVSTIPTQAIILNADGASASTTVNFLGTLTGAANMRSAYSYLGYDQTNNWWYTTAAGMLVGGPVIAGGSPPALSGTCTTSTQVGGNTAGTFHATCTSQTVIMTFATTAPAGWACDTSDQTTATDVLNQTASTQTTATFSGTTVAADVISFKCVAF